MNNKYIYYATLIIGLTAFSACDQTPHFRVEGTISEAEDSMLFLEAMTLDGIHEIDSMKLDEDGDFNFSATAPTNPEFYALRIGRQRINFSIDSTETIRFTAELPSMSSNYIVKGSDNCQKIKEISVKQAQLQSRIIAIENNKSMYPGDIIDSVNNMIKAYKEIMKYEYIFKEPMKAYAYYAVCQSLSDLQTTYLLFDPLYNRDDVKCYAAVATAWDGSYHDAKRTEQICNMTIKGISNTTQSYPKHLNVKNSKISETGIIDIELPDINSKLHKLSSLKGKVVVLDFTMYRAKESSERTRYLRDLYNKYKNKGFEIYQVSLDDDIHFWKCSCENIPWICVHETNGTAVNLYKVTKLPTYFLINRSNELVKRSDDVKTSLEDEIKKLLK